MERRGRLRAALLGSIALVLVVQALLGVMAEAAAAPSLAVMGVLMFVFFVGFNALEATQPSLVSRMAPAHLRGAALGPTTRCSRWACLPVVFWAVCWPSWAVRLCCLPLPRR